jgi:hypothetical protein
MTAAVDGLLGNKDGFGRAALAALQSDDIADLALRAAGVDNPQWIRSLHALTALALRDEAVAATLSPVVDQLLARQDLTPMQRAMIYSMPATAHSDALSVLLTGATEPFPQAARAAWQALQLVARSDSLGRMEEIAPPAGDELGSLARFTIALSAYRGGQTGRELPVFDDASIIAVPADEEVLYSINHSSTTQQDFSLLAALSSAERYLVPANSSLTTTIDCGDQRLLVCLDEETAAASPATLVQAPAMPAIIAVLHPLGGSCAVRFLLLTHPDGNGGFWVGAYLRNGTLVYQGHAKGENISEYEASFSLWAMDLPGARPIALEMKATSAGISLQADRVCAASPAREPLEPRPA